MIGKAIYSKEKNYNTYNDFHSIYIYIIRVPIYYVCVAIQCRQQSHKCVIINDNCKWVISTNTIN